MSGNAGLYCITLLYVVVLFSKGLKSSWTVHRKDYTRFFTIHTADELLVVTLNSLLSFVACVALGKRPLRVKCFDILPLAPWAGGCNVWLAADRAWLGYIGGDILLVVWGLSLVGGLSLVLGLVLCGKKLVNRVRQHESLWEYLRVAVMVFGVHTWV